MGSADYPPPIESRIGAGRFAPSPTGDLHLGNLRTALIAWLSARTQGLAFLVRMENLDIITSSRAHETAQLRSLAELGMDWDGTIVRQSERFEIYNDAIRRLIDADLTYECFCSRREIRDAISAPNGPPTTESFYPGTCRTLTTAQRHAFMDEGRNPALRLRANGHIEVVDDDFCGRYDGVVDDVVLRRNDGVPAYNLAVVVDDHLQGVTEVVRGNDLRAATPSQVHLQRTLGFATPSYRHVPLVLNTVGKRLAKRDGAVTIAQLNAAGVHTTIILQGLAVSIGYTEISNVDTASDLLANFDLARIPRGPWRYEADLQRSHGGNYG